MKCSTLRKYLNETSLHGFGYTDDKSVFFVLFWAVLTAACIACAIRDITGLVQTYQEVPSVVGLTAVPNDNLTLVTPTLCMEFQPEPVVNFTTADIELDVKAFMTATNNGMNLGVATSQMNLSDRLEYITYLMLGYITDFELFYTGEKRFTLTDYVFNYTIRYNAASDDPPIVFQYTSILQHAYNTYMSYNVSLGSLKRLVGMSICRKQIGSARYGPLLGNTTWEPVASICQPDTITHLSFSLLCIKLFNSSTFKLTEGLVVSLMSIKSSSHQAFPGLNAPMRNGPAFYNPTRTNIPPRSPKNFVKFLWRLDLQGRPVTPQHSLQDVVSLDPILPGSKLDVSVAYGYQVVNVPSIRDCSNVELQRDCVWRKTVEKMSQTCTCWPSTLINVVNSNQMPTCSDNPANPNLNITTNKNYLKCNSTVAVDTTGCLPDCTSYIYSVSQLNNRVALMLVKLGLKPLGDDNVVQNTGSVEINFQSASKLLSFVESLTMPFTSFACGFGGIIGTYLGGSILAFIHIPIFIIAQLTGSLIKRKKVDAGGNADEKVKDLAKEDIYPPVVDAKNV